MKTTVELSPALLRAARKIATQEGTTLRSLIEEGLRKVAEDRQRRAPFRLKDGAVGGNGTVAEIAEGSWDQIRDAIYEGHGT